MSLPYYFCSLVHVVDGLVSLFQTVPCFEPVEAVSETGTERTVLAPVLVLVPLLAIAVIGADTTVEVDAVVCGDAIIRKPNIPDHAFSVALKSNPNAVIVEVSVDVVSATAIHPSRADEEFVIECVVSTCSAQIGLESDDVIE